MKSTLTGPKIHDELAEFYSLWRDACLGKKNSEIDEFKFLLSIIENTKAKTFIDLGGSVGLHAIHLLKHGFDITVLDKSKAALNIAKRSCSRLKTVEQDFASISLEENFDIAFCLFSSLTYLVDEEERQSFYNWVKTHINDLIVFDQVNPKRLQTSGSDSCQAEDKHFRLNILREWHFEDDLLNTSFAYEFIDKASSAAKIINDQQIQKFLTVEDLIKYMGKQWRIVASLGDLDLKQPFNAETSPRLITIFKRNV